MAQHCRVSIAFVCENVPTLRAMHMDKNFSIKRRTSHGGNCIAVIQVAKQHVRLQYTGEPYGKSQEQTISRWSECTSVLGIT